ncbi:hypothetical protein AYO38_00825 [bacterium SCGC AG-212-C10]|nr:hypothetical protein AYO38_00825 [bacterium SCGC AG-212-C10]
MNRAQPYSLILGAISGVAFAVLMFVGVAAVDPIREGSGQEFVDWWSVASNQEALLTSMYARLLAVPVFMIFFTQLRTKLRASERQSEWLDIATGGAIAFVVALALSGLLRGVIAQDVRIADQELPGGDTLRFASMLSYQSYGLLVMGFATVTMAAVSVVILQTRMMGRWLGWTGIVIAAISAIAVVALMGAFATPLVILWSLASSVELVRTRNAAPAAASARRVTPAGEVVLER